MRAVVAAAYGDAGGAEVGVEGEEGGEPGGVG